MEIAKNVCVMKADKVITVLEKASCALDMEGLDGYLATMEKCEEKVEQALGQY